MPTAAMPRRCGVIDEALTRRAAERAAHAWRGFLLHALRRCDEEIVELRHAVSPTTIVGEAVLHLGLGYSRRMQYDLALPALRRAVALSDTGAVSLAWLGRVSADAGDVAGPDESPHSFLRSHRRAACRRRRRPLSLSHRSPPPDDDPPIVVNCYTHGSALSHAHDVRHCPDRRQCRLQAPARQKAAARTSATETG